MSDFSTNIPEEYLNDDFDFGFSSVNEEELYDTDRTISTPSEILAIQEKLDMIMDMNSTCEGANAVQQQYEDLMSAKLKEVEKNIIPLLLHLKKNPEKDFIKWPGKEREAKCQLQIERILAITRGQ